MTSVLQFGSNEIVIDDPDVQSYLKQLIQTIISEGRTEWVPFMCELEDGTPQTFELLITPGVPISFVSDAPLDVITRAKTVSRANAATTGSSRLGSSGA